MSRKAGVNEIPKFIFTNEHDHPSDIISEINGDFGRWQLKIILLIFLCKIPASWFMACVIYTAPAPKPGKYYCKPPIDLNINDTKTWIQIKHPIIQERNTDREFNIDVCNIYQDVTKNFNLTKLNLISDATNSNTTNTMSSNIVPCNRFEYLTEFNSLITDFDLVCSRKLLISVTQSFHAMGTLIGGLIANNLLKKISPKRVMIFGMVAQVFCGNLTGIVHSFTLHIFFRCTTAMCCALMMTAGQVIIVDITSGKARTIVITLFELYWSIGLILLPGISIFFDSWTYLYIAISSPTILLIFLCRWITDSPRWLIKRKKIDETLAILLESAAYNARKIPLDLEDRLLQYHDELSSDKIGKYIEIWDGSTKRSEILFVHLAWVWSVTLYNAMILNIRAFGVDYLHTNTVILGFSEMFGILIGLLLILYTRRHWFWSGSIISVAGFFTLFIWLVPTTIKENRRIGMDMFFCTCLKLANAVSMAILTTCTKEMVTAEKRFMLMFSVITFSRIFLMLAPYILALAVFHHLIPITVFAFLAMLTGLFMISLNVSFWDDNQPKIIKVPSPEIYKKTSQIILSRRNSSIKNPDELEEMPQVSILHIWNSTLELPTTDYKSEINPNDLSRSLHDLSCSRKVSRSSKTSDYKADINSNDLSCSRKVSRSSRTSDYKADINLNDLSSSRKVSRTSFKESEEKLKF